MEELEAGVRSLHEQVRNLDDLLREGQVERDLSERLTAAASQQAEEASRLAVLTHGLVRTMVVVVALGLLVWTPFVAYGAVWFHELVRNQCYSYGAILRHDGDAPWYCGIFPGTFGHPAH